MTGSDFYAYVLRKGFKRTDKGTEVYEAITDAIMIMRRKFSFSEAESEAETTDQITVLGDYKLTIESDQGMLHGVKVEDDDNGVPLTRRTKEQFDALYPSADVDSSVRGWPKDYCVYGDQILIGPVPDSVDYNYRVAYSKRGGTVISTTSAVPFTALFRDILCDRVHSLLWDALDEPDRADRSEARFERGFEDATKVERKNKGSGQFCMDYRDI